jgi:hypothetical protein
VLVGVSLMIVLTLAAALAVRQRNRVDREHDETPEDRYQREIPHLRPGPQTWRAKRYLPAGGDYNPPSSGA